MKKAAFLLTTLAAGVALLCWVATSIPEKGERFLQTLSESEEEIAFIRFLSEFDRQYNSKLEYSKRFQIFSENYRFIKSHNEDSISTYTLSVN